MRQTWAILTPARHPRIASVQQIRKSACSKIGEMTIQTIDRPSDEEQKRRPIADLSVRREALRGCALFRPLTPAELEAVLARAVLQRFARGDTIMHRGDPATGMVVILQGRMRVSVSSIEGQETSLGVLGPGDVVGEMALLDGGERSTDVTAVEDGVSLVIQRGDFLPLLENNAGLCLRLMQVLCVRLRSTNRAVEEITTLSLSARLGRLLLRLAESCGVRTGQALRLDLRLSQKDLGTLVGASREKVNRQLRVWEQGGALVRERGYMVIRRPEVLAAADGETIDA
jgi:CRP/FNR family cyclic AMP-dependent transcriptional regulator